MREIHERVYLNNTPDTVLYCLRRPSFSRPGKARPVAIRASGSSGFQASAVELPQQPQACQSSDQIENLVGFHVAAMSPGKVLHLSPTTDSVCT